MGTGSSKIVPAPANGINTRNSNANPPKPEYTSFVNTFIKERLPEPYLSESNYTEMTPGQIQQYLFEKRQERNGTMFQGGRRSKRSTKKKGKSKRTRSRR